MEGGRCRGRCCGRFLPSARVSVINRQTAAFVVLSIVSWASLSACFLFLPDSLWGMRVVTDPYFTDNRTVLGAGKSRVKKHVLTFRLSPPTPCSRNGTPLNLLVAICSSADNFEARMALRNTWVSKSSLQNVNASAVFILGMSQSPDVQRRIQTESTDYRDIIQSDFIDSYKNLSLKTTAMLEWVTTACPNVQYVLKADDDTFINTKNLAAILSGLNLPRVVLGSVLVGSTPYPDKGSKWAVSAQEYSGRYYPKYCSGSAYVLSRDLIDDLYQTTRNTRHFWLEDVYITGFCAHLIDATHVHCPGFYPFKPPRYCSVSGVVATHYVSSAEMYDFWKTANSDGIVIHCHKILPSLYLPPIIISCVVIILWTHRKCFMWLRGRYNKLRNCIFLSVK